MFARLLLAALLPGPPAPEPAPPPRVAPAYVGNWFFESIVRGPKGQDDTGNAGPMVAKLSNGRFELTQFLGGPKPLTGQLVFDPAHPTHVDLKLESLDLRPLGAPYVVPACTLPGVFALDADSLSVTLDCDTVKPTRPARLDAAGKTVMRMKFARSELDEVPKTVRVRAVDPDGKSVGGIGLFGHVMNVPQPELPAGAVLPKGAFVHKEVPAATTEADGSAEGSAEVFSHAVIALDRAGNRMGVAFPSPAALARGPVEVVVRPARVVTVPLKCPALLASGGSLRDTNSYLLLGGKRVMYAVPFGGNILQVICPAGEYELQIYSGSVVSKTVKLAVPEGDGPFTAPEVELAASAKALLAAKPAPEFAGVTDTVNGSVNLADYRGQHVIVDFWGYWCGPCVAAMPALMDIHEKFKGRVAVIGVHVDGDGEIDTAAKFGAKLADLAPGWGKRKLTFPQALVSGADRHGPGNTNAVAQYGVQSFPTTILIGKDGRVIGSFDYRDPESAVAAVEKLLKDGPGK